MRVSPRQRALIALSAAAFALLFGYELVRSSSNALFQTFYGTEKLPLMMTAIPITVGVLVYAYQWLLAQVGPRRSLLITSVFSALLTAACALAIHLGFNPARGVLFIYREAYIVLLLEQYWSFVDSKLDESAAKRFTGVFSGIASLGAILGGVFLQYFSEPLGALAMPALAGGTIVVAAVLSDRVFAWMGEPAPVSEGEIVGRPWWRVSGIAEFRKSRVLRSLLLLVVTTQVVPTVLGLAFQGYLQLEIPDVDKQTAYSGTFYAYLNGVSFVFQFFLTRWLLERIPVGVIHAAIPLIHMVVIGYFIFQPSLFSAGAAFLVFKAFDYSIFRSAKEILYIPLSFEARYQAKQLIDVFGYRLSKGATSLSMVLLQQGGVVLAPVFGWVGIGASLVWLGAIIPIFGELRANNRAEVQRP